MHVGFGKATWKTPRLANAGNGNASTSGAGNSGMGALGFYQKDSAGESWVGRARTITAISRELVNLSYIEARRMAQDGWRNNRSQE